MAMKKIKKRFGTMAVEEGFITVEQLLKAIEIQILEDLATYTHRPIGAILFGLGSISDHQIDSLINTEEQDEFIQAGHRILSREKELPWFKTRRNYGLV